MKIPVVDTRKLSRSRKIYLAVAAALLLCWVIVFVMDLDFPGIIFPVSAAILLSGTSLLYENYTVTGTFTPERDTISIVHNNGILETWSLRELRQVHLWLEGFEKDLRGFRLSRRYIAGINNYIEFEAQGHLHHYNLQLRRTDIPELRALLLTWFQTGVDLRLDDATQPVDGW